MHPCPHCGQRSIPNKDVRWSSRSSPAVCPHCGKLSHVLASTSSGITSAGVLLVVLTLIVALSQTSWLVGIAGCCLVVLHNIWAWRRAELFPISETSAKAAVRANWWVLAVAAFIKLFQ